MNTKLLLFSTYPWIILGDAHPTQHVPVEADGPHGHGGVRLGGLGVQLHGDGLQGQGAHLTPRAARG